MNHINQERIEELKALDDDGSNSVLKELIGLYLESTGPKLRRMKDALKNQDYAALKAEAHSLRSSSLNLGAEILSDLAGQIEYQKESPEYATIQLGIMNQVEAEFLEVKTRLEML